MNELLWIRNARIIDPANHRDEVGDLFVDKGQIVPNLSPEKKTIASIIDARGWIASPGFIDLHTHLRTPGQTYKETIETGTWAAAAGGFTSIVCMPNTIPPVDNTSTLQLVQDTIAREAIVNVFPTACLSIGSQGKQLTPIGSLKKRGIVAVTDDGHCLQNHAIMRHACEYAHMFDLVVMDHCQESTLTEGAVMNEGECSLRLGLQGWPCAAEDLIVSRNIILSFYTGAPIHLQHITSPYSIELIRQAKKRGISITAEATPHHMALSDDYLKDYDTCFKINPPLRTEEDRQILIKGILDGTIDAIATDHAPHAFHEKDKEFDYAPFGIIGLETCLPVCLAELYHNQKSDLSFILSRLTQKPATILKLSKGTLSPGADADIVLFDPEESWHLDPHRLFSRSKNSPWLGKSLRGKVKTTIVGGQIVFDGAKIIPPHKHS